VCCLWYNGLQIPGTNVLRSPIRSKAKRSRLAPGILLFLCGNGLPYSTSQGLHLLERLEWADIQKLKPHPDELIAEMARLQDLQRQTLARWQAQVD
jgi:hypothetical protein